MKYQDFSSDENYLSSKGTICHMWSCRGCHDYLSLSQKEITFTASHFFSINHLHVLKDNYIVSF